MRRIQHEIEKGRFENEKTFEIQNSIQSGSCFAFVALLCCYVCVYRKISDLNNPFEAYITPAKVG